MDSTRQLSGDDASTRRPTFVGQLAETHFYRPGPALAASIILTPPVIAVAATGVSLLVAQRIPVWIPALLLLCCLVMFLSWFMMVRVRTSSSGIAVAHPWRPWRELPWESIERAEYAGFRIILTTSTGLRGSFAPLLLRDGARLRREILVRLSPHILDERLRTAAQRLLADQVVPAPEGGLSGHLQTRPRLAARSIASALIIVALAGVASAVVYLQSPLRFVIACVAILAMMVGVYAYLWLSQRIEMSNTGLKVEFPWPRRTMVIAWSQIQLLEHTPAERLIRLRGDARLTFAGPALLRTTDRDVMRAFLNTYCIERGIPVVQRLWLI